MAEERPKEGFFSFKFAEINDVKQDYPNYSIRDSWEIIIEIKDKSGATDKNTKKLRRRIEIVVFHNDVTTRSLIGDDAKAYMLQSTITDPVVYLGRAGDPVFINFPHSKDGVVWNIERIRVIDQANKNSRVMTTIRRESAFVEDA